jgi:Beta-lactamase superfamily domain
MTHALMSILFASDKDIVVCLTVDRYIVKQGENGPSLYYEPHCVYNESFLENYQADIVITPVVKQVLPFFTLVSGQEDAIKLAKLLQAKYSLSLSLSTPTYLQPETQEQHEMVLRTLCLFGIL